MGRGPAAGASVRVVRDGGPGLLFPGQIFPGQGHVLWGRAYAPLEKAVSGLKFNYDKKGNNSGHRPNAHEINKELR